jgi:hypothetical protein
MILLITKPHRNFRALVWEWILAFGLLVWGLSITINSELFKIEPFYYNLQALLPQTVWAIGSMFVAMVRITSLALDGKWRFSPHLRACTSAASSLMWGSLLVVAIIHMSFSLPSIAILSMPLFFEFFSVWWAAGDAKISDQAANNMIKNG